MFTYHTWSRSCGTCNLQQHALQRRRRTCRILGILGFQLGRKAFFIGLQVERMKSLLVFLKSSVHNTKVHLMQLMVAQCIPFVYANATPNEIIDHSHHSLIAQHSNTNGENEYRKKSPEIIFLLVMHGFNPALETEFRHCYHIPTDWTILYGIVVNETLQSGCKWMGASQLTRYFPFNGLLKTS